MLISLLIKQIYNLGKRLLTVSTRTNGFLNLFYYSLKVKFHKLKKKKKIFLFKKKLIYILK